MNHADHVGLIERGVERSGDGRWADLGAGSGAFTLALRDVAGPDVEIWAVDRDPRALREARAAIDRSFPGTRLHTLVADFSDPLDLPVLDGIVAANALHFEQDRVALLSHWCSYLRQAGRLILVEYDTDDGNRWVPYPVSFASLLALAAASGLAAPQLLARRPSRFLGSMYAALLMPLDDASPFPESRR